LLYLNNLKKLMLNNFLKTILEKGKEREEKKEDNEKS